MAKKKATMTLKDFHGGSIPSDLPLPSAPGATRGAINQQAPWGNSVGRSDHRLRPASTGSANEKTPFFNHNSHIGRNFDEDERKPLDGISGPRRVANDEIIRSQSFSAKEPKIDKQPGVRVGSRPASVPMPQTSGSPDNSYVGRVGEQHNARLSNQNYIGSRNYGSNYGGNVGHGSAGLHPNVWGMGKETVSVKDPVSAAWSASDAVTKLAHASALEKVSSGKWSSKQQVNPSLKDAELFGDPETEYNSNSSYSKRIYNKMDLVGGSDSYDVALMTHAERNLPVADGIHDRGQEVLMYAKSGTPTINVEPYIKSTSVTINGLQPLQPSGTLSTLSSESSERPKLKLLPRSKPLENMELTGDHKQTTDHIRVEDSMAVQDAKLHVPHGFSESVIEERAPERPKLNLKPRTQPLEQLEGNNEAKRGTVFGGARPREVVLKERGMEEDVSHYDSLPPPRVKEGVPKADTSVHISAARHAEKPESMPMDPKLVKYSDRRGLQLDGERAEIQRKNRQNELRRNNRDNEKHRNQQQKQPQDRPPSPESWRRPVEQETQISHDGPTMRRHGKVASAVELAQTFSKSVSNPTVGDRFSGPRGIPSHSSNQVPFSRLTGPTPRPQINGY